MDVAAQLWLLISYNPRKTAVLALAFSVDTSRHKPAEDHEIAFDVC